MRIPDKLILRLVAAIPAVVIALAGFHHAGQQITPPLDVHVATTRGDNPAAALAGHDLFLYIDTSDLGELYPNESTFAIELHEGEEGSKVWAGVAYRKGLSVQVEIPALKKPGVYFIELFKDRDEVYESKLLVN